MGLFSYDVDSSSLDIPDHYEFVMIKSYLTTSIKRPISIASLRSKWGDFSILCEKRRLRFNRYRRIGPGVFRDGAITSPKYNAFMGFLEVTLLSARNMHSFVIFLTAFVQSGYKRIGWLMLPGMGIH